MRLAAHDLIDPSSNQPSSGTAGGATVAAGHQLLRPSAARSATAVWWQQVWWPRPPLVTSQANILPPPYTHSSRSTAGSASVVPCIAWLLHEALGRAPARRREGQRQEGGVIRHAAR